MASSDDGVELESDHGVELELVDVARAVTEKEPARQLTMGSPEEIKEKSSSSRPSLKISTPDSRIGLWPRSSTRKVQQREGVLRKEGKEVHRKERVP